MRYSITLLLAALLISFVSQRIQAQQVIMSSSLTRDVTTGEMVGFSRTEMDFNTQAWYQAYVSNEIRRQSDNALLVSGETFSVPGTNNAALRTSRTPGLPNVTYRLDSKHWILPLSNFWCTFSRYDRYQFTTMALRLLAVILGQPKRSLASMEAPALAIAFQDGSTSGRQPNRNKSRR